MQILNDLQIDQKIERLAYQIYENNFKAKSIILAGINNNGMAFAKLLNNYLDNISPQKIILANIKLDPANPNRNQSIIDIEESKLKGAHIIVVDDVANTGRTLFYAFECLLSALPKKSRSCCTCR